MTLQDFIEESIERYQTQPVTRATKRTAMAFRNGAFRHVGRHIGSPIWAREWDVLVVLDACRYDLWQEVASEYGLPTDETHWSNASCSIDWIRRNFNAYPDEARRTGYVTSNPFADHDTPSARSAGLADEPLGHFRPLYKTEWTELFEGQIATVPPETVTDHAIDAWRNRDELGFDQLVVHYMQPHEPYRARPGWGSGDHKLLGNLIDPETPAGSSIWPALEDGDVDLEEFWSVYQDNLRWVLDDVSERLLENLDGEIVLTADHGNALGELGEWHHPPGAIGPSVRRVPWTQVQATDQGTVQPEIDVSEPLEEVEVTDQLEALGYV